MGDAARRARRPGDCAAVHADGGRRPDLCPDGRRPGALHDGRMGLGAACAAELDRRPRSEHRGQAALEAASRPRSSCPIARPTRRPRRLRGDAGRRRPERLRGRDRPAGADGDLRRLPRRRDRRYPRWVRYLGEANRRTIDMGGWAWASARRLRPSPALARRPDPLLPDQPRRRGRARGRDRRGPVGGHLSRAGPRRRRRGATAT